MGIMLHQLKKAHRPKRYGRSSRVPVEYLAMSLTTMCIIYSPRVAAFGN